MVVLQVPAVVGGLPQSPVLRLVSVLALAIVVSQWVVIFARGSEVALPVRPGHPFDGGGNCPPLPPVSKETKSEHRSRTPLGHTGHT